jgi:hypothetical protein
LTIKVRPRVPATARDIMASGLLVAVCTRAASTNPGA